MGMRVRWHWVAVGAGLTLALDLLVGYVALATRSISAVRWLGGVALIAAGVGTVLVSRRRAAPGEAALGAGLATALLVGLQAFAVRRGAPGVRPVQLAMAWLVWVALAAALSFVGARAACGLKGWLNRPPQARPPIVPPPGGTDQAA
jgi:hypothetical protein